MRQDSNREQRLVGSRLGMQLLAGTRALLRRAHIFVSLQHLRGETSLETAWPLRVSRSHHAELELTVLSLQRNHSIPWTS